MSLLAWQKPSFSEPGSGTCVELAIDPTGHTHLRESATPATVIVAAPTALRGLLDGVKGGASGRSTGRTGGEPYVVKGAPGYVHPDGDAHERPE